MKRKVVKIVPACVYDNLSSPVVYEDDRSRYVWGGKGHLVRLTRKTCFSCNKSAVYIFIFEYKKYQKVERFCMNHSLALSQQMQIVELPDIPAQQRQQLPLTDKQKIAIVAGMKAKIKI